MFGRKEKKDTSLVSAPKRGIKKMDAIVTGLIFGGVIASIYGVKKGMEKKSPPDDNQQLELFFQEEKKKPSFWRRLFSRKNKS